MSGAEIINIVVLKNPVTEVNQLNENA